MSAATEVVAVPAVPTRPWLTAIIGAAILLL